MIRLQYSPEGDLSHVPANVKGSPNPALTTPADVSVRSKLSAHTCLASWTSPHLSTAVAARLAAPHANFNLARALAISRAASSAFW